MDKNGIFSIITNHTNVYLAKINGRHAKTKAEQMCKTKAQVRNSFGRLTYGVGSVAYSGGTVVNHFS